MIKISISLSQQLNLALHAEAINQGASKSEIVRLALEEYLAVKDYESSTIILDS